MNAQINVSNTGSESPIQSLKSFCRGAGISPVTAWRFRNKGWIQTLNISGRQYISAESIAEFKRRAASGEFARVHPSPLRRPSR